MPPKIPRSEKRLERAANKLAKSAKLKARYTAENATSSVKTARHVQFVTSVQLRREHDPAEIYALGVDISFVNADRAGAWSLGRTRNWTPKDEQDMTAFFHALGQVTWGTLYQDQSHGDRQVEDFCQEAQNRWIEIELDQFDTAFRFRLTGTLRLYGVRQRHYYHLIWWDPEHKVYPSRLKHT